MTFLKRPLTTLFYFSIGPVLALVGTAAVARLFALTQPALMQMPWLHACVKQHLRMARAQRHAD